MKLNTKIKTNPKDLLEREIKPSVGDFVTTNDNLPLKAYVLKQIGGIVSAIAGIRITDIGDDVEIHEYFVATADLIYLDESFISVGSELWKYRDELLESIRQENEANALIEMQNSFIEDDDE